MRGSSVRREPEYGQQHQRPGRELAASVPRHHAAVVVAAELLAVRLVAIPRLVEFRRVLDLVLHAVDEDRLRVRVDVPDEAGRDQHLLAEDPGTRVDDDEAAADLLGRLVDLADLAVGCFDLEAGEIDVQRCLGRERPHLDGRHYCTPLRLARLVDARTHSPPPAPGDQTTKKGADLQAKSNRSGPVLRLDLHRASTWSAQRLPSTVLEREKEVFLWR